MKEFTKEEHIKVVYQKPVNRNEPERWGNLIKDPSTHTQMDINGLGIAIGTSDKTLLRRIKGINK